MTILTIYFNLECKLMIMYSKELCYISGLTKANKQIIKVKTSDQEIISKFVGIALNMGIESSKLIIRKNSAFFYNYRIANKIKKLIKSRRLIFKKPNPYAIAYVAGLFDGFGNIKDFSLTNIDNIDIIVFSNLNIHVVDNRIINKKLFWLLTQKESIKMSRIKL